MATTDQIEQLQTALSCTGTVSSDFDLNPDVVLPASRRLRQAAVMVPLLQKDSDLQLILTKRSSALKHHPGQIAFPGGKVDDADDSIETAALREAHEEIGLQPSNCRLLGQLPDHETVTGFSVTPVLALVLEDFTPNPEPGEVEEVFMVPFQHVMDPSNYHIQSRRWQGQDRFYFTVPYGPYYIWGATARMLRGLAERMSK